MNTSDYGCEVLLDNEVTEEAKWLGFRFVMVDTCTDKSEVVFPYK